MTKINSLHIKAYERDLKIRNRSPRTAQNYRETLLQLAEFVEGADLLELDRASVEGYILHVLETRSAASASGRYRALRAFYNWAVREELIPESPMRKMTPPKVVEKPIHCASRRRTSPRVRGMRPSRSDPARPGAA